MKGTLCSAPLAYQVIRVAFVVGLLMTAVGSTIAVGSGDGDWPMVGANPQRTGSIGEVQGPGTGEVLWIHETPHSVDQPPSYSKGRLFVTYGGWHDRGGLVALDARTGDVLWKREPGPIHGTPLIHGDFVVVGTSEEDRTEGRIIVYNLEDGKLIWQSQLDGIAGQAVIHEGILLMGVRPPGTFYGYLSAYDVATGVPLWVMDAFNPRPHVDVQRLVVSHSHGLVETLDWETRETLWEYRVGESTVSFPSVSEGLIVVLDAKGPTALDLATGKKLWGFNATGRMGSTPVPILGDIAVIPASPIKIVDLSTGEIINSINLGIPVGAAVYEKIAFFSTYRSSLQNPYDATKWRVLAVDIHTGDIHWEHEIPYTYGSPSLVNGILYQPFSTSSMGDHDEPGGIVALDAGFLDEFGREALREPSRLLEEAGDGERFLPSVSVVGLFFLLGLMVAMKRQRNRDGPMVS